jgi:choline dehydrogenase-like flavoprotein
VGCKPNAKSSVLVTYVPRAIEAGAIIKDRSMVTRLRVENGRVRSAAYVHEGRRYEQRARTFVVGGYAIETPRLLLSSACPEFPDGLANSSGLVGKRLMTHSSHRVYAWFEEPVRPYKAPPGLGLTQEFYRTPKEGGHARGYSIESGGALPISFARFVASGTGEYGWALRRRMVEYNHYAGIAMNGECLPDERNEVRLAQETDARGMPVAHVAFSWGENERRMIDHAYARMEEILRAAGGSRAFRAPDTAHLMGTCRMGDDPQASVVDGWCRSWDVPNLLVCDGSVFVTSAGVNPSLTIEAIAARAARRLAKEGE